MKWNSWDAPLCGKQFKITMPRKAPILPLKRDLIRWCAGGGGYPSLDKGIFAAFRRLIKKKPPAKASILFQKVGPSLHNPTERLYYSKRLDQNYRMSKSVYIVPQKWTMDKRRKLGVKNMSKFIQNATKRLCYCKRLDQVCITRQSVYIVPQKWTNAKNWVIFSRKIDALSGVICPISAHASWG